MEYHKRKPDFEDEYIRAWKVDKDTKDFKECEKVEDIKVKYKGQEFGLCGFSKVLDEKTKEPLFYCKIKRDGDNWMLMYYVVEDSRKIEIMGMINEYEKKARQMQKVLMGVVNFECKDIRTYLNDALENAMEGE